MQQVFLIKPENNKKWQSGQRDAELLFKKEV
jgi:hypothetical protein